MKPPRTPECIEPLRFPERPFNRPALPHIAYRIGAYSDIRSALLRGLDRAPALASWTHRGPDDPGIALLEGAAILGDILTFYQELYANQAFLRTASWRDSVEGLVRLIGYRLKPGVGGRATFALEVRGELPVVVPSGLPLQADLVGDGPAADFQSEAELTAYPWLSRFALHRPTETPVFAVGEVNELRITPVMANGEPVALAKGDRLLVAAAAHFTSPLELSQPQIVLVESSRDVQGETVVTLKGTLRRTSSATELVAFKLGRTFRHFGHNAPTQEVRIGANGGASATDVSYDRELAATTSAVVPPLKSQEVALDQAVNDLAAGGLFVWSGKARGTPISTSASAFAPMSTSASMSTSAPISASVSSGAYTSHSYYVPARNFTSVRKVLAVRGESGRWGPLASATTLVTLESGVGAMNGELADIRTFQLHEVSAGPFRALRVQAHRAEDHGHTLYFFGPRSRAQALLGRDLVIVPTSGKALRARAVAVGTSASAWGDARPARYPVTLDQELDYADFPTEGVGASVLGNLVDATQGKSEPEAVLGDGDARSRFQTFKLSKAPLTHLLRAGKSPPETPEIEVWVANRRWAQVPVLYGHGPDEQIYIVRQDGAGNSWVQFGDGKTGARLPSGLENVVARYRTGVGAYGSLEPETSVQVGQRIDRLVATRMPLPASGGALAETEGHAREAAPGRIQSLDRLVSLQDFESEALQIAGVARAAAEWALHDGVPAIVITVLMESGREAELDLVRLVLSEYNRCRGPQRYPLVVRAGRFAFVFLHALYSADSRLADAEVRAGLERALGDLFSNARRFGASEWAARVEGVLQNVTGVHWARVRAFGQLGMADDPGTLPPPSEPPPLARRVDCPPDAILRLDARGPRGTLDLLRAAAPMEDCNG